MAAAWAKAALSPPMELLSVPFAGLTLPGYLRLPRMRRPPVVVLLPGADSGKEELFNLADHIAARGLAVAAFDGPGQGMVSFGAKLRPDQEVAVQAIIDALAARPDLDGGRVGVPASPTAACSRSGPPRWRPGPGGGRDVQLV